MANKAPAFQFYAAEYLADENVQLMTLEEEGAYIRALSYCWREGSIPADLEKLSRLCKNAPTNVVRLVAECFNQSSTDPTRLVHKRLEEERAKQKEWKEKSSEAGKKSAAAKKAKKLQVNQPSTNLETMVEPTFQPNGNSSSSSSSSTSLKANTKHFIEPSSKESAPAKQTIDERAEEVYKSYPRKVGKIVAKKAIEKAVERLKKSQTDDPWEYLQLRTKAFAEKCAKENREEQFIPHPSTWFNEGRYDDDGLIAKKAVYREVSPEEFWADTPFAQYAEKGPVQ